MHCLFPYEMKMLGISYPVSFMGHKHTVHSTQEAPAAQCIRKVKCGWLQFREYEHVVPEKS